ncbi:MAG: type II secretion system F family protein [Sporichthyaceae bacterium]
MTPRAPRPPRPGTARDQETWWARLRELGDFEFTPKKIKPVALMDFCRAMSVFLTAGIPVLDVLDTMREDIKDRRLLRAIDDIGVSLRAGSNFSTAIAAHDRALPHYFVHMVRAAEETGQLAPILDQLATDIERDIEARRTVRSAMTYPAIVIVLAMISIGVLIGFVLPRYADYFDDLGTDIPWSTQVLVNLSDFVLTVGPYFTLIALILAVIVGLALGTEPGRRIRDKLLLDAPLIGRVVLYAQLERFCRVLSAMIAAGVPLPEALELSARSAGNRAFRDRIEVARQAMLAGSGVAGPLRETGLFPSTAVAMIRAGEETGTLEERLAATAAYYSKEVSYRLKKLTDLLEPIAVIVVGLVVGFVALAILSAVYGVFEGFKENNP